MRIGAILAAASVLLSTPAMAQDDALAEGFAGALRGCEEWVLTPASWVDGPEPFLEAVGLGDHMGLVSEIAEQVQPPEQWRVGNYYWRINSTPSSGYYLIVSDRLPICHITGGGSEDLQPGAAALLASEDFLARWVLEDRQERTGMVTTMYRHREVSAFTLAVSHAIEPGQRTDRVQLLASAMYDLEN